MASARRSVPRIESVQFASGKGTIGSRVTTGSLDSMLHPDDWSMNGKARTTRVVWDITEERPIPRGERVTIVDLDRCGLWIVEYRGRIYQALPDELGA